MYPSFDEFKRLSKEYERITFYKEMNGDMDTPVSLLSKLLRFDTAILLESAHQNKTYSRFSFLAFDIKEKFVVREDGLYCNGRFRGPLSQFSKSLARRVPLVGDFGDFTGGYVGYLDFEFVGTCGILRSPLSRAASTLGMLYLAERFCVYDNYTNKIYLAVSEDVRGRSTEEGYRDIAAELDGLEREIASLPSSLPATREPVLTRAIPREAFVEKVRKAKEMIAEGEAIQIVLSDFLLVEELEPFDFYRNLRRINPSPYMYFLKDGDTYIVGSSPEVHLRIRDRVAMLKPIAGTKPRDGSDLDRIIDSLSNDEKEKAEHLMLVDLARNDLSRICKVGSVQVESFMQPEVYSHVVHLVSEVKGQLTSEMGVVEALMQTFPAGTVSGAPKVRAIEIIDELEESARGAYAGCIGYIGFNGSVEMAITIRTALFQGMRARLQAGAGIVYDSVPDMEYEEVMNKLKALMRAGGIQ
jgi:anthranilate synthase component 1